MDLVLVGPLQRDAAGVFEKLGWAIHRVPKPIERVAGRRNNGDRVMKHVAVPRDVRTCVLHGDRSKEVVNIVNVSE